jgi:hypothetical protein
MRETREHVRQHVAITLNSFRQQRKRERCKAARHKMSFSFASAASSSSGSLSLAASAQLHAQWAWRGLVDGARYPILLSSGLECVRRTQRRPPR